MNTVSWILNDFVIFLSEWDVIQSENKTDLGALTQCTVPGFVLFNDWITSHSGRYIIQSFDIEDTVFNSY